MMLVDSRNSSSNSLVSCGVSPHVNRCSRCDVPASKLVRQKLGIVTANANSSTNSAAGGRARDYLCTDCLRRERTAPVRLGYECPGWAYGRFGYRCPPLTFRQEVPRIEALVSASSMSLSVTSISASTVAAAQAATYDIVFLGIDQKFGPRIHRRVVKGSTLTLSLEECCYMANSLTAARFDENDVVMADASTSSYQAGLTSTTKRTCLRGIVKMDRRSAIADAAWINGMSFLACPPQKSSMDEDDENDNAVSVAGFNVGGYLNFTGHEIRTSNHRDQRNSTKPTAASALRGQIRVVSSRAIVRSRPDSKATARRRCVRPAIYSTIEEADAILHRHRTSIAPFLSRNLGLPEGPSRLVCEYWCDRPSPLMEFKAGDVVLTTVFPGRGFMNDTISTVLVARRRAEDSR